jgi:hypothetical protein
MKKSPKAWDVSLKRGRRLCIGLAAVTAASQCHSHKMLWFEKLVNSCGHFALLDLTLHQRSLSPVVLQLLLRTCCQEEKCLHWEPLLTGLLRVVAGVVKAHGRTGPCWLGLSLQPRMELLLCVVSDCRHEEQICNSEIRRKRSSRSSLGCSLRLLCLHLTFACLQSLYLEGWAFFFAVNWQ